MYKVLLIEDERDILSALQHAATKAGVQVEDVDGQKIMTRRELHYKPHSFDAVIIAGYFPDGEVQNGQQIAQLIRLLDKQVIIVGTAGDERRRDAFLKAGANAFVTRGSQPYQHPEAGFTKALELLEARDEKLQRSRKRADPTPDQE